MKTEIKEEIDEKERKGEVMPEKVQEEVKAEIKEEIKDESKEEEVTQKCNNEGFGCADLKSDDEPKVDQQTRRAAVGPEGGRGYIGVGTHRITRQRPNILYKRTS